MASSNLCYMEAENVIGHMYRGDSKLTRSQFKKVVAFRFLISRRNSISIEIRNHMQSLRRPELGQLRQKSRAVGHES